MQTLQYISTYLDSIENILISFCHSFYIHQEKINLYTLLNFYLSISKSNTKVSAHYWIIWLYTINICCNTFISKEFSYFFWNMFDSKAIKACYIFNIYRQSNPMSSYRFILIKIYYICPILYFRYIISWINTIKLRFILIIFLYFKTSQRMGRY